MTDKQPKPKCIDCKSAKKLEHIYWTCQKNCIHRSNIDTCIMTPVQFEPREQPQEQEYYTITGWELDRLEKYGLNPDIKAFVNEIRSRGIIHKPRPPYEESIENICSNNAIDIMGALNQYFDVVLVP